MPNLVKSLSSPLLTNEVGGPTVTAFELVVDMVCLVLFEMSSLGGHCQRQAEPVVDEDDVDSGENPILDLVVVGVGGDIPWPVLLGDKRILFGLVGLPGETCSSP